MSNHHTNLLAAHLFCISYQFFDNSTQCIINSLIIPHNDLWSSHIMHYQFFDHPTQCILIIFTFLTNSTQTPQPSRLDGLFSFSFPFLKPINAFCAGWGPSTEHSRPSRGHPSYSPPEMSKAYPWGTDLSA